MWLSKRDSQILTCLVQIYISTHKPVSSWQIAAQIPLSSSTIRKELQKLESHQFIYKTGSSTGRIPTNRALKYYLKGLKNSIESTKLDIQLPDSKDRDFNFISDNLLTHLSADSPNIGIVFLNSIFNLNFKNIQLIKAGPHRLMTILHSIYNCSFSKIFTTVENYSESDLKKWETMLNKQFRGKSLHHIIRIIRNRLFREKEKYKKIYKGLYFLLSTETLTTAELFYKGELNILDSEFIHPQTVKRILHTLEEKVKLSNFLTDLLNDKSKEAVIAFGKDTGISDLEDLILIFSNFYSSDHPIGNIGIIGPKFMAYPNTISKIELFSSYFSKILSENYLEV